MDFSNLDLSTTILFVVETVILIGTIILSSVALFKNYKNKKSLTVAEVIKLQKDITDYAGKVYEIVSYWSDLNPDNFDSEEEYRKFLTKQIKEDLNDLVKTDPECPINSEIFDKLKDEDKTSIIDGLIDVIPSLGLKSKMKELAVAEEEIDDVEEDTTDIDTTDITDIGEHLL